MSRSIVLANDHMLINMDNMGQVRDCFYPYVGMENQTGGHPHKLGILVDGKFSWTTDEGWTSNITYDEETLVSNIILTNAELHIELQFNDTVYHKENIFLRSLTVKNKTSQKREIKFFFHQIFIILESPFGDAVYYHPILKAIIHYKSQRYFLVNGCFATEHVTGITEYTVGFADPKKNISSSKDAEDGQLDGTAVRWGQVDSTIAFKFSVEANSSFSLCYWICAGKDLEEVQKLNEIALGGHLKLLEETQRHWKNWVNRTQFEFRGIPQIAVNLFKRSLLTIRAHTDAEGAILASSDSVVIHRLNDTYSYMWPRDGSLIVHALDRCGYKKLSQNFFKFCADVITPEGYFFHKYLPNRSLGSTWLSWFDKYGNIQLPIQEDETASVLVALEQHCRFFHDRDFVLKMYKNLCSKIGKFLVNYLDPATYLPKPSYDLWEEALGVYCYTASSVYAGFNSAIYFEENYGTKKQAKIYKDCAEKLKEAILEYFYDETEKRFIKSVYYKDGKLHKNMTNDASSTYGIFNFDVLKKDDPRLKASFKAFEQLKCEGSIGGYGRYAGDIYYFKKGDCSGNPWFITTLWLAQYYIAKAKNQKDLKPVIEIFDWVAKHATSAGLLAEQLDYKTGEPISAVPLTWSHATYITTIIQYLEKLAELNICPICKPNVKRE